MEFVLKIFFAGLIAFAPSEDGRELTVLLLNTKHGFEMANGSSMPMHRPLLLVRAGGCDGHCGADSGIATFLFGDKDPGRAGDALRAALSKGSAWQLSRSELSINGDVQGPLQLTTRPATIDQGGLRLVPASASERENFDWVADLRRIAPSGGGFRPDLFEPRPNDIVAARLRLRSGRIITYSVIKSRGMARPIHFRRPNGKGPEIPYRQSLAGWVMAEIHVAGTDIEIDGENFDNHAKRTMKLRPEHDVIEMALVNLPPIERPKPGQSLRPGEPGQHFQIYYDLLQTPPAKADRLVPYPPPKRATEPAVDWTMLHPTRELWSDLLEQLRLGTQGRSPYDLILCPMVRE